MTTTQTQPQKPSPSSSSRRTLDPVTFEVLKNAFATSVNLMSEQILRTCYSFVIYSRDFSSALCDAEGNTVMQGDQDIAVHVGTLHFQCQAVLEEFGDDIHEGDVFAINDPYQGGTHMNDVSFLRPIFYEGTLLAFAQNKGHWADAGGSVPGSFDVSATNYYTEGLRITPVRVWSKGVFLKDVAKLLAGNTRSPEIVMGDLKAQAEATAVCEREIHRLVDKYSVDIVRTALREVQDYVEDIVSARVADLEDGEWSTTDYIDLDPAKEEGLVPIKVTMRIKGGRLSYSLDGSAPAVASFLNAGYGSAFSGIVAGTKTFFPDVPLNSGLYRAMDIDLGPEGTVVNAGMPHAVTGFCSGPFEKIMNAVFELWSQLMQERAMACAFNLEYLLIGGWDTRDAKKPQDKGEFFMWYDWMAGGWGGRVDRDGSSATAPVFGPGLAVQPVEGQERLSPVITSHHALVTDSAGPGKFRGGVGVSKGGVLTDANQTVMSYCCDRSRSVTWGIEGGLPSIPQGVWLNRGTPDEKYLGALFSNVPVGPGDTFERPSAGGGGFGDALERDPQAVLEDVIDGYVSVGRAAKDYGVVIHAIDPEIDEYELDEEETTKLREELRSSRLDKLAEDPESVAERYNAGELDQLDLVRHYGVILDWATGELLPTTTQQYREQMTKRSSSHWK
ncbi:MULTISPECIES: hydantoinase B/oxoprolinase family protein [Corynebacterium]|uniref:hydantoinase B/oxoprolinase family protein n=1 Tax=Corynebacterium TaxID=1716 RepID=UPI0008A5A552|nr:MULTISPECIES: hydantoinase B/oxoprolinase family protein [unclassified Corynebacterium]MDK6813214.1 hydantoinase B/oxoprolinase family protein [Corynebacterium sp. UMB6689]OFL24451.1 methylhydantoinase [Corynebacterium sp. HMSC062A03]OFP20367.1 methylhydantoinase [Corynebacterium sp. HMSC066C02]OFS36380.1 methylhydantoinase [Corynebacterium sp. HMSC069E04]